MKNIYLTYGVLTILFFSGCVSQGDFDKLQAENEKLKIEYDECQNGAEKLIAKIEKAYSNKNYKEAKYNIILLSEKHPEVEENKTYKELIKIIEKEQLELEKVKIAEEKEKVRLKNLNNTGMWFVSFYVDDFGEPTKEGYIRNLSLIKGSFSNSATQDSKLNVKFLISSSTDISIMLYEYAGNNPVKAYSPDKYSVLIQDKDGERLKLVATNYSDRLSFSKSASKKIHNYFMKGGTIKFRIYEIDTPTTEYSFSIKNADWYNNAYTKLEVK